MKTSSIYVFLCALLMACSDGAKHPDVSHIDPSISVLRTERHFISEDSLVLAQKIETFYSDHIEFADVLFNSILPLGQVKNRNERLSSIMQFYMDKDMKELTDTVLEHFPDNLRIEDELRPVFKYWVYYFPEQNTPKIYTYQSAFNYGVVMLENDIMGIGLDFFLGKNFVGYHQGLFPDFIRETMDAKYLGSQVAKALIKNVQKPIEKFRLLDHIVDQGKVLYCLDKLMPTAEDSLKLTYPSQQLIWLNDNEAQIWNMILQEDWLYNENRVEWTKMVSPSPRGPSTMPPESPGESASWIGKKIIENYMRRKPDISLIDLLQDIDADKILAESRYKPR